MEKADEIRIWVMKTFVSSTVEIDLELLKMGLRGALGLTRFIVD